MSELSTADRIWNRACFREAASPGPGDQALQNLLMFHNLTMNGGVLHAFECLKPEEHAHAQAGYRYFDFDEVADFIGEADARRKAEGESDELEWELDDRYSEMIPLDQVLVARFESVLDQRPADFAPLE